MEKDKLTRVPYFFSICAIILDMLCGLDYTPFIQEWDNLMALVEQLKDVVRETGNLELIGISAGGATEEEKQKHKDNVFDSVKFFFSQSEILADLLSQQKNAAASAPLSTAEVDAMVEAAFTIESELDSQLDVDLSSANIEPPHKPVPPPIAGLHAVGGAGPSSGWCWPLERVVLANHPQNPPYVQLIEIKVSHQAERKPKKTKQRPQNGKSLTERSLKSIRRT